MAVPPGTPTPVLLWSCRLFVAPAEGAELFSHSPPLRHASRGAAEPAGGGRTREGGTCLSRRPRGSGSVGGSVGTWQGSTWMQAGYLPLGVGLQAGFVWRLLHLRPGVTMPTAAILTLAKGA